MKIIYIIFRLFKIYYYSGIIIYIQKSGFFLHYILPKIYLDLHKQIFSFKIYIIFLLNIYSKNKSTIFNCTQFFLNSNYIFEMIYIFMSSFICNTYTCTFL